MRTGEILSYPLVMIASVIVLAWTVISALRSPPSANMDLSNQLIGLSVFMAGFLLSAVAHTLASRLSRRAIKKTVGRESFNSVIIHEMVHVARSARVRGTAPLPPWELTSASLVGRDNSLALAKLRLDLERALRELAFANNVELIATDGGVVRMAEALVARGVVEPQLVEPLRQITSVCSQAIHGYDVSDDLAESVVLAGNEILTRLDGVAGQRRA